MDCGVSPVSYGYNDIRIKRDRNGYSVRVTDPKVQEANRKRDTIKSGEPCSPWQDPEIEYNFTTKEQTLTFITSVIEDALPVDDFSAGFDKAAKEALGND